MTSSINSVSLGEGGPILPTIITDSYDRINVLAAAQEVGFDAYTVDFDDSRDLETVRLDATPSQIAEYRVVMGRFAKSEREAEIHQNEERMRLWQ